MYLGGGIKRAYPSSFPMQNSKKTKADELQSMIGGMCCCGCLVPVVMTGVLVGRKVSAVELSSADWVLFGAEVILTLSLLGLSIASSCEKKNEFDAEALIEREEQCEKNLVTGSLVSAFGCSLISTVASVVTLIL